MKKLADAIVLLGAAVATCTCLSALHDTQPVRAMPGVKASTDTNQVPKLRGMQLTGVSTPAPGFATSAEMALAAAKSEWNLQDSEISATVVSAMLTLNGDARHKNEPVWIVTADHPINSPNPREIGTFYRHLCVVINATTGRYDFAYSVDPFQAP